MSERPKERASKAREVQASVGSNPTATAPATPPAPSPAAARRDSAVVSGVPPGTDLAALRARRLADAERYRPRHVRHLFVAPFPPGAPGRSFYTEDVGAHDSLFRHVARVVLGGPGRREDKPRVLARLRDEGVFLVHLATDPVRTRDLPSWVPSLVARVTDLDPDHVLLVGAACHDVALRPLQAAGAPVVDVRIPFPGSGQQRRFTDRAGEALGLTGRPPAPGRRMGDSNPRGLAPNPLSKRAP